jgi:ferric-dicitrate binding protein FerR (iron transport regulator)
MTLQSRSVLGLVRQSPDPAQGKQGSAVASGVVRGLILAIVLFCVVARGSSHAYGQEAAGGRASSGLLGDEGVMLSARSRVSVHRTAEALRIHVLAGEVSFKLRGGANYSLIVTAGSASLSHIEGAVCVGVDRERTVISVLEGAVDMFVLNTDGQSMGTDGIPLRGGDRVELRRVRHDVALHFAGGYPGSPGECGAGTLLARSGLVVKFDPE